MREFSLGRSILEDDDALGSAEAIDGTLGRGAAGWAVVLLWAAAGITGGAAWDLTKLAARRFRERLEEARSARPIIQVSAGGARLLAIQDVIERYPDEPGPLDLEGVGESSALSGLPPLDSNYVGVEPWIVVLVSATRIFRYVVVVMADGSVGDAMRVPVTEAEQVEGVRVVIPGGTKGEASEARRSNLPEA